jgi:hypothetical protein
MNELGVFEVVSAAVATEVAAALEALRPWRAEGPTPLLLGLVEVLQAQVAGLHRSA